MALFWNETITVNSQPSSLRTQLQRCESSLGPKFRYGGQRMIELSNTPHGGSTSENFGKETRGKRFVEKIEQENQKSVRDYASLAQKILTQHKKPISYLTSKIDAVFGNAKEIIDNLNKRETRRIAFGATTIVKSTLDRVTGSLKPESVEIQRKNKNILVTYDAHGQIERIHKSEKIKRKFMKDFQTMDHSFEHF